MMRRKLRTIVLLSLCNLALLAGIITLIFQQVAPADVQASVSVLNIPLANVEAIGLNNVNGSIGMALAPTAIEVLDEMEGEAFSQEELMAFVYQMVHLTASKEITDFGDGSAYGLASPQATLVIIAKDGDDQTLKLLQDTAIEGQHYLYHETANAMYAISATDAALMLRSRLDFTDKELFPTIPLDGLGGVTGYLAQNASSDVASFSIVRSSAEEFSLTAPISQKINKVEFYTDILVPLSELYPEKVLGDMTELDFSHSSAVLSLIYNDVSYEMNILENEDGYFAMMNGTVYEFSQEDFAFLGITYMDLLKNKVFDFTLGDLATVQLSGTISATLDLQGDSTELVGQIGTTTLDYLEVGTLFEPVNGVEILGRSKAECVDNPQLILEITTKLGATSEILFGQTQPDGSVAVSVDGVVNFDTTEKFLHDITTIWSQYHA